MDKSFFKLDEVVVEDLKQLKGIAGVEVEPVTLKILNSYKKIVARQKQELIKLN